MDSGRRPTGIDGENSRGLLSQRPSTEFMTGAILKETAMSDASQSKMSVEPPPRAKDQSASQPSASPSAKKRSPRNSRRANTAQRAEKIAKPGNSEAARVLPEAAELSRQMARIAEKSRALVAEFLEQHKRPRRPSEWPIRSKMPSAVLGGRRRRIFDKRPKFREETQ
jgi:hypothetical protein